MAPDGTWTCISAFLKKSGSMPYSFACVRSHDSAARADSFMTSPSWPVSVSEPVPAIRDASMNSTSPPAGVQARPMATPGSFGALLHLLVEELRRAEHLDDDVRA